MRAATTADVAAIARVHVDAWRSTYRGIVPQAFLDGLSYRDREALWHRVLNGPPERHGVFVAEAGAQGIVGFADGARPQTPHLAYEGRLSAIYIVEAFQGRGLGRDLVLNVVAWFVEHGIRSMLVWVLADNPACRFYEALGGTRIEVTRIEIGGAGLEEVAYGWADVTRIMRPSR
ncbi:MAG TPA: GNAT family N-acetyltransferase [bacterium]|nr:GNAT family N-acetyltransferase [bacterium]